MKGVILILLIFSNWCFSQNKNQYQITYTEKYNGKTTKSNKKTITYADVNSVLITTNEFKHSLNYPKQQTFFNTQNHNIILQGTLKENVSISTVDSVSVKNQNLKLTEEYQTILGYKTRKATTSINSNSIEIWFTTELPIKAAPNTLGINLGTVLKYSRNNDYVIEATELKKLSKNQPISLTPNASKIVNGLDFQDALMKARYETIPIFKNEIISFNDQNKSNDSILKFANGTVAVRKVKFPKIKKGSLVFIDVKEQANGDAYDRTGSVFAILPSSKNTFFNGLKNGINTLPLYDNGTSKKYQGIVSSDTYETTLELMRFFTPFGINHFNHIKLKDKEWNDWVDYRQDISEFNETLSDQEVYIGIFIGNYDKGGHKITANITIHPNENNLLPNKVVMPLFNTTNVMEMGGQEYPILFENNKTLKVVFKLDGPIKNAYLRYIATGHGGWENGDEFVPKHHDIILNKKLIQTYLPWRVDCASYRLDNPASGNFANGLSSSDLSRANWCPGTVTNPTYIYLGDIPSGTHEIEIRIPQGLPEGGSFSYWNVSGVLLGNH